jgi:hypothetical protein
VDLSGASTASGNVENSTLSGTMIAGIQAIGIGSTAFVLPVKLVYFKGNAVNCNAALTWQTATETNANRFEVEYSTDGISFRKAGTVKAAGTSTSIVNYQFAWPLSNGNNYFRLKMIDRDGKIDYSNIVALANSCTSNFGVLVYPNPLTVNTTVKVSIAGASKVNILVYSAAGQLVENRPSVSLAGQNGVVELNAKIWAPGMYMIRVINSSTREEKVVKFLKE